MKKLFKKEKNNVILSETKNLMRSFTFVQDDRESGRSIVEMLGVLAVMGVLSVGGVAMYTNAMNKYRANELLNESSKRAVVIATQILSGKSISADMMNQFDNNGTTFTGVEAVGTNQFKLTLSGVDDDVCTQLKATVGSNTIIQEVGDKCVFLTFNNDLSKGTSSSNTGGSASGNEQQEPVADPCADVICQNGGTCSGGTCNCIAGYTGDHCETQLKTFTCTDNQVFENEEYIGNCYYLNGCKGESYSAVHWLDMCNSKIPEGKYFCSNSMVYNSSGQIVETCNCSMVELLGDSQSSVCDMNGPE